MCSLISQFLYHPILLSRLHRNTERLKKKSLTTMVALMMKGLDYFNSGLCGSLQNVYSINSSPQAQIYLLILLVVTLVLTQLDNLFLMCKS